MGERKVAASARAPGRRCTSTPSPSWAASRSPSATARSCRPAVGRSARTCRRRGASSVRRGRGRPRRRRPPAAGAARAAGVEAARGCSCRRRSCGAVAAGRTGRRVGLRQQRRARRAGRHGTCRSRRCSAASPSSCRTTARSTPAASSSSAARDCEAGLREPATGRGRRRADLRRLRQRRGPHREPSTPRTQGDATGRRSVERPGRRTRGLAADPSAWSARKRSNSSPSSSAVGRPPPISASRLREAPGAVGVVLPLEGRDDRERPPRTTRPARRPARAPRGPPPRAGRCRTTARCARRGWRAARARPGRTPCRRGSAGPRPRSRPRRGRPGRGGTRAGARRSPGTCTVPTHFSWRGDRLRAAGVGDDPERAGVRDRHRDAVQPDGQARPRGCRRAGATAARNSSQCTSGSGPASTRKAVPSASWARWSGELRVVVVGPVVLGEGHQRPAGAVVEQRVDVERREHARAVRRSGGARGPGAWRPPASTKPSSAWTRTTSSRSGRSGARSYSSLGSRATRCSSCWWCSPAQNARHAASRVPGDAPRAARVTAVTRLGAMSLNVATMLRESANAQPRQALLPGQRPVVHLRPGRRDLRPGRLRAARHRACSAATRSRVQLPNLPQFLFTYFGLMKAGLVMVPLNPLLRAPEVAYHLQDSDAKVLDHLRAVRRRGGEGCSCRSRV